MYILWALENEETRRVIEAAHEYAIERVLEWIEDEVAVIRYGKDGIYRVRPPGGLVAARFRHYEARSSRPLLHDHLLLSVKAQRLDGRWGSIHTTALHENTVAASALYNELVASEVCEALGLATEPRTVTPGRRPVMEIAGVPHELIRWTARRSDQIAACLTELEHEYVTAVDDDGEQKFLPVVSERARAKLNAIAARKTRPPKQKTRPLAQLRAWWKTSATLTSGVAADVITSLLEHARAAAAAIRARVAAVVDVALAAVDVTATVFVMNDGGRFHRRHLLAEPAETRPRPARPPPRPRPGRPDCLDTTEPKTIRGLEAGYRPYTARWSLSDLPARRTVTAGRAGEVPRTGGRDVWICRETGTRGSVRRRRNGTTVPRMATDSPRGSRRARHGPSARDGPGRAYDLTPLLRRRAQAVRWPRVVGRPREPRAPGAAQPGNRPVDRSSQRRSA
ncbi:MobF family relaxase [Streptomyces griseofuscus]|uniref:MobF family relaxase n=1 Tax=Streptomyces griseofuscus TaxID=146922 RepID=UPI00368A88CD